MTPNFVCLIIFWLLPLKSNTAVTIGLNHNINNVTATANMLDQPQRTTQRASMSEGPPGSSDSDFPPSTVGTETVTTERFQISSQSTVTPIQDRSYFLNLLMGTTEVKLTTFSTTDSSKSTETFTEPTTASSQTESTANVLTSSVSRSNKTSPLPSPSSSPSSSPVQPTSMTIGTASTKPGDKSTSGDATRSSTTTLKPTTQTTKAEKNDSRNRKNYSKIVAGLIGGALLLMIVGFVVIYVKKKQGHKHQELTDWAGPSPFLSGADNGNVTLRSSNRISLSSFLPQRLSKRLSLLPEMEAELHDMTQNTTFEGKHLQNPLCQETKENDAQNKNGTQAVTQQKDIPKTNNAPQTKPPEITNHTPDESEKSTNLSGDDKKAEDKKE